MTTYNAIFGNYHRKVDPQPLDLHHPAILQPTTPAGLFLVRKYNVPPSIADVLAIIAGLGAKPEAN